MKIGVSCITERQDVITSCRRLLPEVNRLNAQLPDFGASLGYDHMLMSFVDEHEDFFKLVPNRDRILQAEVGYDPDCLSRKIGKSDLISYARDRLMKVIEKAPIAPDVQRKLADALEHWEAETL